MELNNQINLNNNIINEKDQKNFLESTLGKTINTGIDIGIRALLPNFVEDQVISLKENLLNYGLKDGIQKTVSDTIDIGKSAIGIVTGNFESVSQMQNAVKTGGLIDGISSLLDTVITATQKSGLINSAVASTLKQGKNLILNNVENNIQKTFTNQIKSTENLEKYINNWKGNFENKDFYGMEKEYTKMKKELTNLIPVEKAIGQARTIENLHNLIKNNGQDFNLTKEQIELAEKLK